MKSEPLETSPGDDGGSAAYYRQKYKALKRKLRLLVYEQECLTDDLKTTQRKLLKVSRDKSFLLDRLLLLETLDESSSDSDATASSDSDADQRRHKTAKRRKRPITFSKLPNMNEATAALLAKMAAEAASQDKTETRGVLDSPPRIRPSSKAEQRGEAGPAPKKRSKTTTKRERTRTKKSSHSTRPSGSEAALYTGMLSREEVERQLDAKKPVMGIEKAQATLPMDIFNDDNSLQHVHEPPAEK